jgi:MarR family 2-MHQ and catechol resistance regulon transcriptional repressor
LNGIDRSLDIKYLDIEIVCLRVAGMAAIDVEDGNTEATGVHTWLILSKARRVLETFAVKSIESMKVCPTDFSVLELLLHKGPLPVNTIGKRVFVTSGSITAAVDRLESANLVERRDDPNDRRVRVVALTHKGKSLIEEKFAEHVKDIETAFSALDAEEITALQALLRKLGKGAEKMLQG